MANLELLDQRKEDTGTRQVTNIHDLWVLASASAAKNWYVGCLIPFKLHKLWVRVFYSVDGWEEGAMAVDEPLRTYAEEFVGHPLLEDIEGS